MSTFTDIATLITAAPCTPGYAPTGATLPYVVLRPLDISPEGTALAGNEWTDSEQYVAYCAGGSVEASYNLALMVRAQLSGKRVAGTTLATSVGYIGAQVEGHYESAVTVQLNTGGN